MAVTAYVTRAELKAALGIKTAETGQDTRVDQIIERASRDIDEHTNRRFYLDDAVSARVFRLHGRTLRRTDREHALLVDDIGSTTGLIVELGSFGSSTWTSVSLSTLEYEPENAAVKNLAIEGLLRDVYWGTHSLGRVRITAKWGWPAVPGVIAEATLLQAARLYRRKDSPEGVTAAGEWGPVRVSKMDHDVKSLIKNYVRPAFA